MAPPNTLTAPAAGRRSLKRKACLRCTKLKRKCDKSAPFCVRCLETGVACHYPPLRNPLRHLLDQLQGTSERSGLVQIDQAFWSVGQSSNVGARREADPVDSPIAITNDFWFICPDTWPRQYGLYPLHSDADKKPAASDDTLAHFVSLLQTWMQAWTTDGHSVLIHRHLYSQEVPTVIQDALTALAAYHAAAAHGSAKGVALRIVQDRARQLVDAQRQLEQAQVDAGIDFCPHDVANGVPFCPHGAPCIAVATPDHLARTQALFVYQLVLLFDGDIRSRALGEQHVEMLHKWACQLVESTRLDAVAAARLYFVNSLCLDDRDGVNEPDTRQTHNGSPALAHAAWVLAESVRRVYLAAELMQSAFQTLKTGRPRYIVDAPFSAKASLWDAPSPAAWLAAVEGRPAGAPGATGAKTSPVLLMVSRDGAWRIMDEAAPDQVDDFARAVLEMTYGRDSVETWLVGRRAAVSARFA
ncbi:hypothetical protein B0T26DRAFT_658273 [Lasiosphaeria miniovina]|uniref:Zn(2)-C6 fungal-type domain-containing protein n=1 Tax=Lasiosphaeria miniovina TaxID=1954250 RepID=A0AA39ZUM6_9PEZI|nr:uncharacterized protein B0T26DRAFT_658273 [Lasiosphaeria miniovina]KAK0703898.1 hypothetical protein B0T26DRAFT_658273 [Lasiosphaeria miniovina]